MQCLLDLQVGSPYKGVMSAKTIRVVAMSETVISISCERVPTMGFRPNFRLRRVVD